MTQLTIEYATMTAGQKAAHTRRMRAGAAPAAPVAPRRPARR